jgi:hypothetical protein
MAARAPPGGRSQRRKVIVDEAASEPAPAAQRGLVHAAMHTTDPCFCSAAPSPAQRDPAHAAPRCQSGWPGERPGYPM